MFLSQKEKMAVSVLAHDMKTPCWKRRFMKVSYGVNVYNAQTKRSNIRKTDLLVKRLFGIGKYARHVESLGLCLIRGKNNDRLAGNLLAQIKDQVFEFKIRDACITSKGCEIDPGYVFSLLQEHIRGVAVHFEWKTAMQFKLRVVCVHSPKQIVIVKLDGMLSMQDLDRLESVFA